MATQKITGNLDVTGNILKNGVVREAGTKLYQHSFHIQFSGPGFNIILISSSSTQITGVQLYNPFPTPAFILDDPHTVSYHVSESTYFAYGKDLGGGQAFSLIDIKNPSNEYTLSAEPTITDTVTEL